MYEKSSVCFDEMILIRFLNLCYEINRTNMYLVISNTSFFVKDIACASNEYPSALVAQMLFRAPLELNQHFHLKLFFRTHTPLTAVGAKRLKFIKKT